MKTGTLSPKKHPDARDFEPGNEVTPESQIQGGREIKRGQKDEPLAF